MKKIYILHENAEWISPLRSALEERGLEYEEWFINQGSVDFSSAPPDGVFYNRMSASSHTRDHRYAMELAAPTLAWLEAHGRRVINSRHALQLEVSKAEQYLALNAHGIRTPASIVTNSAAELRAAAERLGSPVIVKPNRGGKGTGVQLLRSADEVEALLDRYEELVSPDGISIVQEYVKPRNDSITRVEFIGGKFFYAVRVDTSDGFELCPADVCTIEDAFCPTEPGAAPQSRARFEIIEGYVNNELEKYERFLAANGMEIAAIEYVQGAGGRRYVYDVNVNTNYNSAAEALDSAGRQGMSAIAEFLGRELAAQRRRAA